MIRGLLITLAFLYAAGCSAPEEAAPAAENAFTPPAEELRALIRDARALAPTADALWPGFSAAPFGVLLVEGSVETLFCHGKAAEGFAALGEDAVTGCDMQARTRTQRPDLLAAFPAVDSIETIVAGTPEATGETPLSWTVTLLHEHFHQFQSTLEGNYARLAALDLAGGDETGMWMLNYPFPYDRPEVVAAFDALAPALDAAVDSIGGPNAASARAAYLEARAGLQAQVSAADWRYYELQMWKEGVARWVEIAIAERSDDAALAAYARNKRKSVKNSLAVIRGEGVSTWKRSAFYAIGASEAMLLEADGSAWRRRYMAEPFALGPYF